MAPTRDNRMRVRIIPGIKQPQPADVMRGEETQVAGYLWLNPNFEGLLCLPGTHSKWVRVESGQVRSFRTYMTGELYSLLSGQSVLRHSVDVAAWQDSDFVGSLRETFAGGNDLTNRLFSVRSESLIGDLTPGGANARLSGLLLGAELASMREWFPDRQIELIDTSDPCIQSIVVDVTAIRRHRDNHRQDLCDDGLFCFLQYIVVSHSYLLYRSGARRVGGVSFT